MALLYLLMIGVILMHLNKYRTSELAAIQWQDPDGNGESSAQWNATRLSTPITNQSNESTYK